MFAVLEQNPAARSDCSILSLSWKGTVPSSEKEKNFTRKRHYTEGWLATGNEKGIVSASYTTSLCKRTTQGAFRRNFNLRGHNTEVILVRWNEPFQKMATCDAQGVIFVWIKYEGRWSVELVNDRSCQVSDFCWSHDGRMALICYKDGFVLVGSVTGQRYWSSMLNLDGMLLCGTWSPDDKQVLLGTSDGLIMVMDVHGAVIARCNMARNHQIKSLLWSTEKFRMVNVSHSEGDEKPERRKSKGSERKRTKKRTPVMAADIGYGEVQLMKSYDDVSPIKIKTGMADIKMEWSNCGAFLAVGGTQPVESLSAVKFYDTTGHLRFTLDIPSEQRLSSLTWGHNDLRVFIACGSMLHVAWVFKGIAPLQVLCREVIVSWVPDERRVSKLPLPARLRGFVTDRSSLTVKNYISNPSSLREFVCLPPSGNERLHCTMVRSGSESGAGNPCFMLLLEFMGGLVPLLKGRRVSKLRPEFVIYDPQSPNKNQDIAEDNHGFSDSDDSDLFSSDEMDAPQENIPLKTKSQDSAPDSPLPNKAKLYQDLYKETLPERAHLVEVTSNIWGTKFKIFGIPKFMPPNLGQVNYRTSLLHLQPRQMTIALVELRPDFCRTHQEEEGEFDPHLFSEDEEEEEESRATESKVNTLRHGGAAPVAPMAISNRKFSSEMDSADFELIPEVNDDDQPDELTNDCFEETKHIMEEKTKEETSIPLMKTKEEMSNPLMKTKEETSIPLMKTKEEYIQQGAIPKHILKRTCSAEKSVKRGSRTSVGIQHVIPLVNGEDVCENCVTLGSNDTEDEELRSDLPHWANTATLNPVDSVHDYSLNRSCSCAANQLPIDKEESRSSNSEPSPSAIRSKSSARKRSDRQRSKSTREGDSLDTLARDASRERSLSSNCLSRSPEIKSRVKGHEKSESGSTRDRTQSTSTGDSSKEPSKLRSFQRSKSASCADNSSPQTGTKIIMDSSESDEEDGDMFEDDTWGSSSARTRKAKLVKQYAQCKSRVFVMHNKAPLWNENTQVYQLDFGGRVTQESAKNFQVELQGKQVMQFGRIDGQAYTLDFQYPFSAVQAFAVALANVTQRLK